CSVGWGSGWWSTSPTAGDTVYSVGPRAESVGTSGQSSVPGEPGTEGNPYTGAATQCADRKSTRLNSSHVKTSYAVFGLKKNISFMVFTHSIIQFFHFYVGSTLDYHSI